MVAADVDGETVGAGVQVGEAEPVDAGGGQGVEQHEAAGDPVDEFDGVVGQQPGEQVEPVGFGDAPRGGRSGVGDLVAWAAVGADGPAQERSGQDPGGRPVSEPGIEIGLGARDQLRVSVA